MHVYQLNQPQKAILSLSLNKNVVLVQDFRIHQVIYLYVAGVTLRVTKNALRVSLGVWHVMLQCIRDMRTIRGSYFGNDKIFNPYNPQNLTNDIGDRIENEIEHNCMWQEVSDFLTNCKYKEFKITTESKNGELKRKY